MLELRDSQTGLWFDRALREIDPGVADLIAAESERQRAKLVLIPSESITPRPVLEALASPFAALYAEGYPAPRTSAASEESLLDLPWQLALHRRYADRRYYRGDELANIAEALAQRRVAALFATPEVPAEAIHANVQPLSGAAANNAVYDALLKPGDTILSLALTHGGHLTHGSEYNRSGRMYRVVHYTVDPASGRIDYEQVARLAEEHQPRLIVAGASAYPWIIDWARLRAIADSLHQPARLLADVAHPAGLIVAGLFPNPIGTADVVSFTTHKTLCGPRGACILTARPELAPLIDRAVFPGEQGGPHQHAIVAKAVAFRLAATPEFRELQRRTVANARALADALTAEGLTLAYGGTETHLLLIDLNTLRPASGVPLKGEMAARLLDLCGLVCNKNTIPGDASAGQSSAIRLGTTWVSQRGLDTGDMRAIAAVIADVLRDATTFEYFGTHGPLNRAKISFAALRSARARVAEIAARTADPPAPMPSADSGRIEIRGERALALLQGACTANLAELGVGQSKGAFLLEPSGAELASGVVTRLPPGPHGWRRYLLEVPAERAALVREWLEALSDGYVRFDAEDVTAKLDGPVVVATAEAPAGGPDGAAVEPEVALTKPFFVGRAAVAGQREPPSAREVFTWQPAEPGEPRRSALYQEHLKLTAERNLVPFAGWSMPVWYTSIAEEHRAVRTAAALFDVSHMGVLEVAGEYAERFLDLLTTNYVPSLAVGASQYSYVLGPDGGVLDDVLVYRLATDRFLLVANAANAEKVLAWFQGVNERRYQLEPGDRWREVEARVAIRDLKDPTWGAECRVDLALQGPRSPEVLAAAITDPRTSAQVGALRRGHFTTGRVLDLEVMVARTGYTGEEWGYELFVHPEQAPRLWRGLLEVGAPLGLRPTGLGARDSARTEAGFPLYGHELAGPYDIDPIEAGYGNFVKLHKAFFVGKRGLLARQSRLRRRVVRFAMEHRGIRMVRQGDPVVSPRGEVIGHVTSAVAVEGQQIGMAVVEAAHAEPGTPLGIIMLPRQARAAEAPKPLAELRVGDRVPVPEPATVLPRFASRRELRERAGLGCGPAEGGER